MPAGPTPTASPPDFHRSHRRGARGVDVGENAAIATNEDRVARHAHVQLEIGRWPARPVLHSKREHRQAPRRQRLRVAHPHDACVARRRALAVVADKRRAANGRQVDLGGDGFGQTGCVHQVREQLVASGRHVRKPLGERAGPDFVRVKMPQPIERRRDDEQVHQVIVVGDEVVDAATENPSRIAKSERQPRVAFGDRHRRFERLVDVPSVIRRLGGPPLVAQEHDEDDDGRRDGCGDPAAPPARRSGRVTRPETRLARHRRHDADEPGAEDEHAEEEQHA